MNTFDRPEVPVKKRAQRDRLLMLRLHVLAVIFGGVIAGIGLGMLLADAQREPIYDLLAAGRKPLVIVNGQTQQLQTTDWLTSVGGITTNANTPAAGEIKTDDLTAADDVAVGDALGVTGLSTLTGGFTLGADSSAASHKITNLTNGASAQDAAAFGQIATAVNAAVSGTSGRSCRFSGTNAVGNGAFTDDGTNATANGTVTSIVAANTFGELRGNVTSPAALTARQDDYTGCATNTGICQISASNSNGGISGMTGGAAGRLLRILNIGATNGVVLYNEFAGSTAAYRFTLPGAQDWNLRPNCAVTFEYDGTNSRWRFASWACNRFPAVTIEGLASFSSTGGVFNSGLTFMGGSITPSSISGTNNDYNPTGFSNATTVYQNLSADATITGLATQTSDGRVISLHNVSVYNLTLAHQNAGSTATWRFKFPDSQDVIIPPNGSVLLRFTTADNTWRLWDSNNAVPTFTRTSAAGADPTLSSCGTSPTVIGSDGAGTVTIGTGGVATACTITFAKAWATNAPSCVLTSQMSARTDLYISASSTTAITVSNGAGAAWPASGVFNYQCIGVP